MKLFRTKMWALVLSFTLCLLIAVGFSGCNRLEIPEGIENKDFYYDMVNCLKLIDKALGTKNRKHIDELEKVVMRYSDSGIFENYENIVKAQRDTDNRMAVLGDDYGLNEKEMAILSQMLNVHFQLSQYLNDYYQSKDIKANKIIDLDSIKGKTLYENIQVLIDLMGTEFQIDLGETDEEGESVEPDAAPEVIT